MELAEQERTKLHKNLLYIMDEIHRICVENSINYSLFYGSLIGAVVHEGFIPWDDDIDIVMFKEDYLRFVNVCQHNLRSDFFLQSTKTEKGYLVPGQTKVRLNGTVLLEEVDAFRNIHHGVSVDIVVFEDTDENFRNVKKTKYYFSLFKDKYYYHAARKSYSIKGLIYHTMRRVLPPFTIKRTALSFEKWATQIQDSHSKYVFLPYSYPPDIYRREWLDEFRLYTFEGRQYMGFKKYDQILKVRYPSYRVIPPIDEQKTNHSYSSIVLKEL